MQGILRHFIFCLFLFLSFVFVLCMARAVLVATIFFIVKQFVCPVLKELYVHNYHLFLPPNPHQWKLNKFQSKQR